MSSQNHIKKSPQPTRGPPQINSVPQKGLQTGYVHSWGHAESILIPVPVPSPGWWHGSQQARHGYTEAKGHFSELSAAAHLCVSLVTLRREDQVHRKRWDLPGASKSPPESISIEIFPKSSSKMFAVIRMRKRSLWLQVGPVDIDCLL